MTPVLGSIPSTTSKLGFSFFNLALVPETCPLLLIFTPFNTAGIIYNALGLYSPWGETLWSP